jgi:hypothetical protein
MRTIIAVFRLLLSRAPGGKNFSYLPIEPTRFGLGHQLIKALCKFMEGIFWISARLFGEMPTEKLLCVKYDGFFAQLPRRATAAPSPSNIEQCGA